MMDYPCAKLGDLSFSRFGFMVRTNTQTHKSDRITDVAKPFTPRLSSA